ncbi:MAG TPA: hypothetical protein VMH00_11980 [Candidatus Limnocylindrales bacterium]|nr:hypothetical protein [Candidatus Limnocylindrales bacterium]
MKVEFGRKWAFALPVAVLLAGSSLYAAPKKRTQFEMFVPVAPQPIKADNYCGNLSGALSAGDFFEGLERIGEGKRVEFRKDKQPIREFPSKIAVALAGSITPCPNGSPTGPVNFVQPGNGSSPRTVNEFIQGLKFTAVWKNRDGVQPVQNWSVIKTNSSDKSRVNDQIPTRFAIQVPSQGIPLTNQLVISVYAPSGAKLCTFTAGVLSHFPKHHLKTIQGQQSE